MEWVKKATSRNTHLSAGAGPARSLLLHIATAIGTQLRPEKMLWFLVACPSYIHPWVQTHNQVIGSLKLPPGICMGRLNLPWAGQLALNHCPLGLHHTNMPGLGLGPELVSFLRLYVLCWQTSLLWASTGKGLKALQEGHILRHKLQERVTRKLYG